MSVAIRGLNITIGGKSIVRDVNMDIADGERVGLVGSSGSGKSMISKAIMGLLPATASVSGSILMGDAQVVGASDAALADLRGRYAGMVFQNPGSSLNPVMTVAQQIALPLRLHYDLNRAERLDRVRAMLDKVGLPQDAQGKYPHELSGGQQQRVGIARAFVARPEVVFADEPTGNLDSRTKVDVMEMICSFARDFNQTIVLVTHDDNMAQYADRIVTLLDGRVIADEPADRHRGRSAGQDGARG